LSGWPSSLRHVAPDQRSPLPCRASIRRQAPSSPNLAHCCACSPLDLPLPGHMHIEFCTFRRRQTVKHGPREEWSYFRTHRHLLREGRLWPGRILWSAPTSHLLVLRTHSPRWNHGLPGPSATDGSSSPPTSWPSVPTSRKCSSAGRRSTTSPSPSWPSDTYRMQTRVQRGSPLGSRPEGTVPSGREPSLQD